MRGQPDTCKHFRGIQHETCAAGVTMRSVRDTTQPGPYRWPCFPAMKPPEATTKCHLRVYPTQEEVDADERAWKEKFALIFDKGMSPCCKVPLDESRVDEHGTGPRYCSSCKAFVFQGCARVGDEPLDESDDEELAAEIRSTST